MTELTEEENLVKKALVEEKSYNWLEATKLYEQVANSYLKKTLTGPICIRPPVQFR